MTKQRFIKSLEYSKKNIFISEFTLNKTLQTGLKQNFKRDFIFHNCIDTTNNNYNLTSYANSDEVTFCVFVRDTPHKNLIGCIKFCELYQKLSNKKVTLIIGHESYTSEKINIVHKTNTTNSEREEIMKQSHFNLLLSLDHSKYGFYEGFGLTVLEAALFGTPSIVLNTGGLSEAVHDKRTGFVLEDITQTEVLNLIPMIEDKYQDISLECFKHTIESHGVESYSKIIKEICLDA